MLNLFFFYTSTDIFNNKLTGSIPEELARLKVRLLPAARRSPLQRPRSRNTILLRRQALQILHLKGNRLTGTIPEAFGRLPYLSWLDISENNLLGTIPLSFAESPTLEDFRIAGNMLYGEVPDGLCTNPTLNDGMAKLHGCSGVLCPTDTYAGTGYATESSPCLPCPDGQSSLYLGSLACITLSEPDFLAMLYEVMQGPMWSEKNSVNWLDTTVSVCEWAGIECDSNGVTTSLNIPLMATIDS